jgi:hypothetical protein
MRLANFILAASLLSATLVVDARAESDRRRCTQQCFDESVSCSVREQAVPNLHLQCIANKDACDKACENKSDKEWWQIWKR